MVLVQSRAFTLLLAVQQPAVKSVNSTGTSLKSETPRTTLVDHLLKLSTANPSAHECQSTLRPSGLYGKPRRRSAIAVQPRGSKISHSATTSTLVSACPPRQPASPYSGPLIRPLGQDGQSDATWQVAAVPYPPSEWAS